MLYHKTADQSVSLTLLNKTFCTLILKFRLYIFCFLSVVLILLCIFYTVPSVRYPQQLSLENVKVICKKIC